ncbi:MAG: type II secretion system F family protein [Nitrospirota bacterium]
MPVFVYKAGREDGSVFTKEADAESPEALRKELEESGYLVLQLKKRHALGLGGMSGRKKQKTEDFLVFNQELLVLIRAGLPIVQSLDILADRTSHPAFKDALVDVKTEVRGGKSLSDAMSRHPGFFPELFCNSLRAGERTGALADVLERFIIYQKRLLDVKRKMVSAMTYPAFIVGFTVLLLIFLLTYVVPAFTQTYADAQASLPLPTLMLMKFTHILKHYFPLFVVFALGMGYAFRAWYRTENGRLAVDKYLLKVPLIGSALRGYIISTMTRTLSTILSGGIPMLQALEMVSRSITNREVANKMKYVQERVREGISLAGSFEETKIMPIMTIRMIEVGEATGALEAMLDDISNFYEDRVNIRLQRITSLIEPIIIATLGLIVGSIVIIMYLPIFEMAGTVK